MAQRRSLLFGCAAVNQNSGLWTLGRRPAQRRVVPWSRGVICLGWSRFDCGKGLQLFQLDVLNPVAASRSGLVDCLGAERVVRAHPSVKDFMQSLMSVRSCLRLIEVQARCQRCATGRQTSSQRRKLFGC
eukprot:3868936-Rhodomonas_salina.1